VASERSASMGWVHAWLTLQSAILVLASVNRLSDLTLGYVAANEFLRWVDLLNLLALPLASTLVLWLLWRELQRNTSVAGASTRVALELAFVAGIYLLAASYGTHEVTNYLNTRFCLEGGAGVEAAGGAICRIIAFNDDEFSHWVFFAGFSIVNASLMLQQWAHRFGARTGARDLALLTLNGGFIALALFANLAFEEIGLDLWVVVGLAALALGLLIRVGRQPLFVYYSVAYGAGLAATMVYR
jgi:hypothetical protein